VDNASPLSSLASGTTAPASNAGNTRPHTGPDRSLQRLLSVGMAGALLIAAGPWLFDAYLLNILIKAFFFSIVAISVDVLWGYTGYLTFGQSAFFGIGAYAAGLVFTHQGFSAGTALLGLALAVGVSAMVGAVVGWLSFYRGASPFFATVISLVLPIVVTQLLLSGGQWTGSSSGLTGYTSFDLSTEAWFWIVGAAVLAACWPRSGTTSPDALTSA
jgi:branched-chain amino acid transport system permease protein